MFDLLLFSGRIRYSPFVFVLCIFFVELFTPLPTHPLPFIRLPLSSFFLTCRLASTPPPLAQPAYHLSLAFPRLSLNCLYYLFCSSLDQHSNILFNTLCRRRRLHGLDLTFFWQLLHHCFSSSCLLHISFNIHASFFLTSYLCFFFVHPLPYYLVDVCVVYDQFNFHRSSPSRIPHFFHFLFLFFHQFFVSLSICNHFSSSLLCFFISSCTYITYITDPVYPHVSFLSVCVCVYPCRVMPCHVIVFTIIAMPMSIHVVVIIIIIIIISSSLFPLLYYYSPLAS